MRELDHISQWILENKFLKAAKALEKFAKQGTFWLNCKQRIFMVTLTQGTVISFYCKIHNQDWYSYSSWHGKTV